mgnify:CR=1 FL=1
MLFYDYIHLLTLTNNSILCLQHFKSDLYLDRHFDNKHANTIEVSYFYTDYLKYSVYYTVVLTACFLPHSSQIEQRA